ncbi:MAG: hypothetical protein J6L90_04455 [Clostridia bacterium]|nr:hypothetical protein [Clostridia bacterium]
MKSFKIIFIIGLVVIALIVGMIIGIALPENTVDFNGRVIDVSPRDDGTYVLRAESVAGGEFSFIIDGRTKLVGLGNEDIDIDTVSVGGIVLINYRSTPFNKTEIKTVKDLTYFVGSENTHGN